MGITNTRGQRSEKNAQLGISSMRHYIFSSIVTPHYFAIIKLADEVTS